MGWNNIPSSLNDFTTQMIGLPGRKGISTLIYLLAGLCWALWHTRNDWVFSITWITNPYKTIGFLQLWCKMASKEEQTRREEMLRNLNLELWKI